MHRHSTIALDEDFAATVGQRFSLLFAAVMAFAAADVACVVVMLLKL